MDLEGIISISGRIGLFKVISQGKNAVIVENLIDKKRIPLSLRDQTNTLKEIVIYTYNNTISLSEIFDKIVKKEKGLKTISHKSTKEELKSFFGEILSDYDEDRVYISDMKKVANWYNLLHDAGLICLPTKEKDVMEEKK